MLNTHRMIGSSLFVVFLFSSALAQVTRPQIDNSREPVASGPLVTATATAKRVRFVSPGTAVQLRLEVYNEAGQKLFDTELHGGNVLDWHLQDGAGQGLPAGSYACVLTTKSLSGRLSQRVGLVRVKDHETAVEATGVAQLSTAQLQTIGPVEGNAAFAVLQESEAEAMTAVTHDGTDGQVTSTAGALTLRTGDLFSGKDIERMRITPEGNVGIGTDKPAATLDVAGAVRASEGFRFSDGTTLDAAGGKITFRDAAGETLPVPLAAGTGTIDRVAKWIETGGAGTLADSAITETGGLVGIGVTNPGDLLDIAGAPNVAGRSGIHIRTTVSTGNATVYFDNDRNNFAAYGGLLTGGSANPSTFFGLTRADKTFLIADGPSSLGMGIGTLVSRPVIFGTANAERMRIESSGNVGIGTISPGHRLDVAGNINTSTQYNIGGNRVLSNAGTGNLFAGRDAGNANTGLFNSFVGASAGIANTTGFANSFLGATAGGSNTDGFSNSFFGFGSGNSNSTGDSNSFFGVNAGFANTTANNNSFFGADAGEFNTIGNSNAFFGFQAGHSNSVGGRNSFFGYGAGSLNTGGSRNSSFGTEAGMSNTGQDNVFVGDKAGMLNTQGIANTFIGAGGAEANTTGSNNTAIGAGTVIPDGLSFATVIGAGASVDQLGPANGDNTVTLGREADEVHVPGSVLVGPRLSVRDVELLAVLGSGVFSGYLKVDTLGTVGAETLCRNVFTHKIALCSSSLRYKTDILPFISGLKLVNRLQPIAFSWKDSGKRDLGLGAEDVEKVEPLLVTYNDKGEVEGVKYDRVAVVLLNAVREQQVLITKQQQELERQQRASLKHRRKLDEQRQELDALRTLVCKKNRRAKACK